jgi:hypothetical protein
MKNSRQIVLERTKQRLKEKYDFSLIEEVEKNFWNTLRQYLNNPLSCVQGIYLNRFMKFHIRFGKLKWLLENDKVHSDINKETFELILKAKENGKK